MVVAVGILSRHGGKGIASEVPPVAGEARGRVRSRHPGISVGGPVEAVASRQSGLVLLKLHQGFHLVGRTVRVGTPT